MRKFLPLVGLLFVACGPPDEPPATRPTEVTNNAPAPANNEANNEANNDTNNEQVYGVKNPDRIFQLDTLEKTTLKTPGGDLNLWIMDTKDKEREGMMFLKDKEVKDNEGMIFVFKDVQVKRKPGEEKDNDIGFWMSHTLIPLDIVYISKDKKVVNVGKGKPLDESIVVPAGDYQYVIEVKQGLASKFGLEKGKTVDISSKIKAKE